MNTMNIYFIEEEEKAKELELARIELERETALLQMTDSEKRAYYFDNKYANFFDFFFKHLTI